MDGVLISFQLAIVLLQTTNAPDAWKILASVTGLLGLVLSVLWYMQKQRQRAIQQEMRLSNIETFQSVLKQAHLELNDEQNIIKLMIDRKMDKEYCSQTMASVNKSLESLKETALDNNDKLIDMYKIIVEKK